MIDLTRRSLKLAGKTAQAGLDAAVTIAARAPGLVAPGLDLSGERSREVAPDGAGEIRGRL